MACVLACTFGVFSASAQSGTGQNVRTKIYYGTKASDSMKNPCKGECVTVCAKIIESYVPFGHAPGDYGAVAFSSEGMPQTLVTSTLTDAEGNVLNECEEIYDGEVDTVMGQLEREAVANGATVE